MLGDIQEGNKYNTIIRKTFLKHPQQLTKCQNQKADVVTLI